MVSLSTPGIREGNYTSWTHKWTNEIPNHLWDDQSVDFHIDEDNKTIILSFSHPSALGRFAILNLADFSTKFMSPTWPGYTYTWPDLRAKKGFEFGNAYLYGGGVSHSIKTYSLIFLSDWKTIEVWRSGASPVWSRDIKGDFITSNSRIYSGLISLSGRYILVYIKDLNWNDSYLMLYEGT